MHVPTPFLDRTVPLPRPIKPRPGMTVVVVVWSCVLAALALSLATGRPPALRHWLLTEAPRFIDPQRPGASILFLAGWTVVVSWLMVGVHEGGHVLAGLASGHRFRSIRVGPVLFTRGKGLSLHHWRLNQLASGVAVMDPVTTRRLVPRATVLLWGGPAANILSGGLVLLLPFAMSFPALLFIVQSIGNGLSDLLPYRNSLGVSDGKFLWTLWRRPALAERWLALMKLGMEREDGVFPEAMPAEFLAKATAPKDDSLDTVAAHALGYSTAFHQRKDAEAAEMLDTCLRCSGHGSPALREALMSDAAVFQARRRGRADLAEQWLADLPAAPRIPWLRPRTEAAILEARGDVPGALEKLASYERLLSAWPDASQRGYLLWLLPRWRSDLGAQGSAGS
jgi:hypothetical protein